MWRFLWSDQPSESVYSSYETHMLSIPFYLQKVAAVRARVRISILLRNKGLARRRRNGSNFRADTQEAALLSSPPPFGNLRKVSRGTPAHNGGSSAELSG